MEFNIAVLPGDGVGTEVISGATAVLEAAQRRVPELKLNLTSYAAGAAQLVNTGTALSEETFDACMNADAILLGAIGLPEVREENGTEVGGRVMFKLRFALDLYAGVRPIKTYAGVPTPLSSDVNVDMTIVRESTEGLFASYGGGASVTDEVSSDTMIITQKGTRRVVEKAFELAAQGNGRPRDNKRAVTVVDKANVFRSMAFFRRVATETAENIADGTELNYQLVDAMALLMVQRPEAFDIVVTENMYGDILSDLGAALVGGMGMAPSGDIGLNHALFQPSHGSAPDIAGKGIANPIATILSAKMMLEWLATRHDDAPARTAAGLIDAGVEASLKAGWRTPDIGGTKSCSEVADAVATHIDESAGR